jgi:hypothetical protein
MIQVGISWQEKEEYFSILQTLFQDIDAGVLAIRAWSYVASFFSRTIGRPRTFDSVASGFRQPCQFP